MARPHTIGGCETLLCFTTITVHRHIVDNILIYNNFREPNYLSTQLFLMIAAAAMNEKSYLRSRAELWWQGTWTLSRHLSSRAVNLSCNCVDDFIHVKLTSALQNRQNGWEERWQVQCMLLPWHSHTKLDKYNYEGNDRREKSPANRKSNKLCHLIVLHIAYVCELYLYSLVVYLPCLRLLCATRARCVFSVLLCARLLCPPVLFAWKLPFVN